MPSIPGAESRVAVGTVLDNDEPQKGEHAEKRETRPIMSSKARRPRPRHTPEAEHVSKRMAIHDRLATLHADINRLRRARATISRNEFAEVVKSLRQIQQNTDDIISQARHLATQVTRMAQMQVEIDTMRRALDRAQLLG